MLLVPVILGLVMLFVMILWFWKLTIFIRTKEAHQIFVIGTKPIGVTILVTGVLVFLSNFSSSMECIINKYFNFYAVMGSILSVGGIISGLGIILLKKWATYLVQVLSVIFIFFFIKYTVEQPAPDGGSQLVMFLLFPYVILSIFNFYYFTRPKVKEPFK
jgi:hypothetical protein